MEVARLMLETRELNRGSAVVGTISVSRDVFSAVTHSFYCLFYHLEEEGS